MRIGFVVLAHTDLYRAAQMVRHLSEQDCAVAVHIDKKVEPAEFEAFQNDLEGLDNVIFPKRTACEWGEFSLVQATLDSAEALLKRFEDVTNVQLISGSCLPIRPVKQLKRFLSRNMKTDFIESVSVKNNFWVKDGLNEERFTMYFPFSWRTQRWRFDKLVALQRRLGVKRKIPEPLVPHIGSQWWCLTAKTLRAILDDPKRPYYDAYFNWAWIPDESYFQTLARLHSDKIASRSLTFSKFDYLGKPFVFYDDHLKDLTQSDCFWARKMWVGADRLYDSLLDPKRANQSMSQADPKAFDARFEEADQRRCEGGTGRFHQGRFPYDRAERTGVSETPYTVFVGFKGLYREFPDWIENATDALSHGSVFARSHVGARAPEENFAGNLPAVPSIRNRNPKGYLANLLWPARDRHQCLLYDFRDNPRILQTLAHDPMAHIVMIRHSWLLSLLNRPASFENQVSNARRFHRIEQRFLREFAKPKVVAHLHTIALENAVHHPSRALEQAIAHIPRNEKHPLKLMPERENVEGLENLTRKLRDRGLMIEYEFPTRSKTKKQDAAFERPYVVK
ncbi:DUF5927 domain-containing protein [Neptunicoccus cionae]|uniref:DUF5927 domain-containing protein n=1 Tax=Neptunicoccus cionae TaxID=2035344 RepID=UPI000C78CB38|nr:beta-1,6-N-acetylglucosaminyltransferase [Amylibacter cionae]PLS22752.1 glycosyl transferase [Amylibacter cionae]